MIPVFGFILDNQTLLILLYRVGDFGLRLLESDLDIFSELFLIKVKDVAISLKCGNVVEKFEQLFLIKLVCDVIRYEFEKLLAFFLGKLHLSGYEFDEIRFIKFESLLVLLHHFF